MINSKPTTPRDQSQPTSQDQYAKNEEAVKDLQTRDTKTVKGGAVDYYLYLSNPR